MNLAANLDAAIKVVCPIYGVSIGREDDRQTWRIDFKPEATLQQRTNAQAILDTFDPQAITLEERSEISTANARETVIRTRTTKIEEFERRISSGALQEEINSFVLNILKEQK